MSEEGDEQMMQKLGKTPTYLLSLIAGISLVVLNIWYTFTLPVFDLYWTWILVILNIIIVVVTLGFAYLNENILRTILKSISLILLFIGWSLSLVLFALIGIIVFGWFLVSLVLMLITFKWLKETDEGGEVAYILRKNWSYYTCLVLGVALILLFVLMVWLSETSNEFLKLILMGDCGLLVLVSMYFPLATTRKNRLLLTVISASLAGLHAYLSVVLYPEIAVYVFGWFGFALLLLFAAYNWLKE